jgi:hypothetical protein
MTLGDDLASDLIGLGALEQAQALGLRRLLSRPGFHYLWWPGIGH